MPTLGHTTVESETDQWPPASTWEVCFGPYTMTENGTLVDMVMYWQGVAGGDYTLYFAVWNDSGGVPLSRFAYSSLVTVPQNAAMASYTGTGWTGSTSLVSGNKYWFGFNSANNPGSGPNLKCKVTGAASICEAQSGQGLGIPTDPFPTVALRAEEATIYIDYLQVVPSIVNPSLTRFPKFLMRR